tara:strand:- start:903 stop:1061 length:159 start_codon:yes stop_codon:yes gene_type:complete
MKMIKGTILGGISLGVGLLTLGTAFVVYKNKEKIISRLKNLQFRENKSASRK